MTNDAPGRFATTRWSLVARAADADAPEAREALDALCRAYWFPLYAFLRRSGTSPPDAEDLVQGFFARALEKDWIGQADRERGRFRTFLLASLRHFAANERERAGAKKRGGGRTRLSLDLSDAESRYAAGEAGGEPAGGETPERLYERRFARELLERALAALAARHYAEGAERAERFLALKPLLWDDGPPSREVAARLGTSETAVRVALHRLRGHLREAIRAEVREVVADASEVDDEIARLSRALGNA